jgi:triphosphoribosyl-dephospho-CoA synthase
MNPMTDRPAWLARTLESPRPLVGATIGELVKIACGLEATAPKAGNVHPAQSFRDLRYEDFLKSAEAIEDVFSGCRELALGQLVLQSIQATKKAIGSNTNLGIVLLVAPLAKAIVLEERHPTNGLEESLCQVLGDLTLEDSRNVFQAIVLANPGGLGQVDAMDVRSTAPPDLISAMRAAADRDQIAAEYVQRFRRSRDIASELAAWLKSGLDWPKAICQCQVAQLAREPDSLIARKASLVQARLVQALAQRLQDECQGQVALGSAGYASLDSLLRSDGHRLNPGTTADLIAAGIFLFLANQMG